MQEPSIDFANALWEKQKEYMKNLTKTYSRFRSFSNVFNYFEPGQTIAQIACGSVIDDLFLTMDRIGKNGKIILIDEKPDFIYNRACGIIGEGSLPQGKDFYVKTKQGREQLQELFFKCNIEAYVQYLPPYPKQIHDESIDHVMAINAAFELMGRRLDGPIPNVEGLIVETYKKLKNNGSFIVQGLVGGDVDEFGLHVFQSSGKSKLNFTEEYELKFPPLESLHAGEWKRWIKVE